MRPQSVDNADLKQHVACESLSHVSYKEERSIEAEHNFRIGKMVSLLLNFSNEILYDVRQALANKMTNLSTQEF